ncbi:hypothetical protein CMI37_11325 [Candidatus Pacearchaeota archaeon]|nr:hypothetical protein [Candidatus Pacearchaeota archaeon]
MADYPQLVADALWEDDAAQAEYDALSSYEKDKYYFNLARNSSAQFTTGGGQDNAGARDVLAADFQAALEQIFIENYKPDIWFDPVDTQYQWGDEQKLFDSPFVVVGDEPWGPAAQILEDTIQSIASEGSMSDQDVLDRMGGELSLGSYAETIYGQFLAKYNEIAAENVPDYESKVDPDDAQEVEGEYQTPHADAARQSANAAAAKDLATRTAAQAAISAQVKTVDFKEQCFLLAKIFKLIEIRRDQIDKHEIKTIPYIGDQPNSSIMTDGEPYGFINRLVSYPSTRNLFELPSAEIASLVPRIELYKVGKDENNEEVAVPIYFDGSATSDDVTTLLQSKGKRGFGVGIKDFTFSYEGSNPFSVKKSIKASLTLFANSFDEIMKDRGGYRYVDLALKTGGEKVKVAFQQQRATDVAFEQAYNDVGGSDTLEEWLGKLTSISSKADQQIENLAYLNYRIKAIVGWQYPAGDTGISSANVRAAINDSVVTLNLTPTVHEFDFDEQGRVVFKMQYYAYIEETYDEKLFSIFSDPDVFRNVLERKLKYVSLDEDCGSAEMGQFKKENTDQIDADKRASLQFIFKALSASNKIRYLSIPHSELKELKKKGPYYEMKDTSKLAVETLKGNQKDETSAAIEADINKNAAGAAGEDKPVIEFVNTSITNANSAQIVFFYLSDLIDVIMAGIDKKLDGAIQLVEEIKARDKKKIIKPYIAATERDALVTAHENWQKYRVVLGPVEIVSPENPEHIAFANLGDIPISLRYFMEWLTEKTLKKDEVNLPIATFLNSLINNLVNTFLNDDTCFKGEVKQSVRLFQSAITAYKRKPDDPSDSLSYFLNAVRLASKDIYISRLPIDHGDLDPWCPLVRTSGPVGMPISDPGVENEIHYMLFYAGRVQPVEHQNGDYTQDQANGIQHYILGRDSGIIKNIQLKRTEVPYLKEVRFQQNEFDGLSQLREVYDVTINCYAHVNAFPGLYIFVDPRGFAPNMAINLKQKGFQVNDLSDYGIGGYYMIYRSEHSFGPGRADTTISAKWVSEMSNDENTSTAGAQPNEQSQAKCTIKVPAQTSDKGSSGTGTSGGGVATARADAKKAAASVPEGGGPATAPEPDQNPNP